MPLPIKARRVLKTVELKGPWVDVERMLQVLRVFDVNSQNGPVEIRSSEVEDGGLLVLLQNEYERGHAAGYEKGYQFGIASTPENVQKRPAFEVDNSVKASKKPKDPSLLHNIFKDEK